MEYVFLVRDVCALRTPNIDQFTAARQGQVPPELADKYIDVVTKFFENYRITGRDSVLISKYISDPDYYEIIKVLREGYVAAAELPMKIEKEVKHIE